MKKSSLDEHLTSAGMAFNIILFLPVFLTNLVGIFSESYFAENKWFFPTVLLVDLVMIALFYSNYKNREYRGEGIYYSILLLLITIALLGVIVSYFLKVF